MIRTEYPKLRQSYKGFFDFPREKLKKKINIMIDYNRIAKEMARNIYGVDEKEMNELLNDEYYVREHLLPKSFEISESKLEFSFDMSDIHWFNDFESSVEWEKGDDFDSDKLEKALEDEIYKGIRCEYNGFSFIVNL